jgi:hypothetical protein
VEVCLSSIFLLSPRFSLLIQNTASGEVFKGTFRGTEVAVKKIITSTVSSAVIQEFELEVAIMWYVYIYFTYFYQDSN